MKNQLFVLLLCATTAFSAHAQSTRFDSYQNKVESRLEQIRKENEEKRLGKRPGATNPTSGLSPLDPRAQPDLKTYGAQWKYRAVRYNCAQGQAVSTRQKVQSKDFANAVNDRKGASANTTQRLLAGKKPTPKEELDALDALDESLKKSHPMELKFKYKTYPLTPERGALGLQFINRSLGVVWSERAGKATLKNIFSGRVLAFDCRAGVPFETDAPESADADLSAFSKKPALTN
jgi:hypothetical protein